MLADGAFALEVGEFAPWARDRGCFARFSRAMTARFCAREFCGFGAVADLVGRQARGMVQGRARCFAAERLRRRAILRRSTTLGEWVVCRGLFGAELYFVRRRSVVGWQGVWGGGLLYDDLFGGCDQLAEAADFEGGILQSGQGEASVVARLAKFLHVINYRVTLACREPF